MAAHGAGTDVQCAQRWVGIGVWLQRCTAVPGGLGVAVLERCWGSVVVFRGVWVCAGCARVVIHVQGCAVVWLSPGLLCGLSVGCLQGFVKVFP